MTDEQLRQAIEDLNDAKAAVEETAQDIAIAEKNIALIRAEMQQEKRDAELRVCVKEFFEKYLNRTEESDGGKMFNPIVVSCCRAMMTEPLNNLLAKMSELSGAAPKENIYMTKDEALKKPCEYCGQDLPLGVDKPTRQVRSYHFSHCTARPEPEPELQKWVGLTAEEVNSWELPDSPTVFEFVQFIEAKLKEKNT